MKLKLGTRRSRLALAQAEIVAALLEKSGTEVDVVELSTLGDTLDIALTESGGKELFVKEIDEALIAGEIDLAVHSMKDLGAYLPEGISIAAVPAREDARDAFISFNVNKLSGLKKGATIGTSSPRRRALVFKMRPDIRVLAMRGNVETRIEKLRSGEVDGIILAVAGLKRIGRAAEISEILPIEKMLPAVGQGALAVCVKSSEKELITFIKRACHNEAAGIAVRAERAFLKEFGGDCHTPLAAHAIIDPKGLTLMAFATSVDESHSEFDKVTGLLGDAQKMGTELAKKMKSKLGI